MLCSFMPEVTTGGSQRSWQSQLSLVMPAGTLIPVWYFWCAPSDLTLWWQVEEFDEKPIALSGLSQKGKRLASSHSSRMGTPGSPWSLKGFFFNISHSRQSTIEESLALQPAPRVGSACLDAQIAVDFSRMLLSQPLPLAAGDSLWQQEVSPEELSVVTVEERKRNGVIGLFLAWGLVFICED